MLLSYNIRREVRRVAVNLLSLLDYLNMASSFHPAKILSKWVHRSSLCGQQAPCSLHLMMCEHPSNSPTRKSQILLAVGSLNTFMRSEFKRDSPISNSMYLLFFSHSVSFSKCSSISFHLMTKGFQEVSFPLVR